MKTTIRNALVAAVAGALFAPAAFAQNFNALPLSGKAKWDAWPGYFWSYFAGKPAGIAGGLAYRYKDNVSAAELFDKAFGNGTKLAAALPKIQAFGECALKAKQACMPGYGGPNRMNTECLKKSEVRSAHAACKKDFAMDTVTAHEVVNQGIGKLDADFWWGICHGWAAAAVLFKEPVKNVTYNGVTFRPGDIKGYLSVMGTDVSLTAGGWTGSRYDGPSSGEAALNDVTPRQYHNFMAKFLGAGHGVVVDRYTGAEVWNQPTDRFETTCKANVGTGCSAGEVANTCQTTFTWAEDHGVEPIANGVRGSPNYTSRTLNYTICVKDGLITGEGKWNHDPNADKNSLHPDFMWAPGSLNAGYGASNPMIATRQADIVKLLANPSAGSSGSTDTGVPTTPEKKVTASVNKAIPDNNTTGVTKTITVKGTGKIKTYATCLNITHTYRGDLLCTASYGGKTATVWNKEGGSTDNINTCISHTSFRGLAAGKSASVKCADVGRGDTGKWVSLEVRYTLQ